MVEMIVKSIGDCSELSRSKEMSLQERIEAIERQIKDFKELGIGRFKQLEEIVLGNKDYDEYDAEAALVNKMTKREEETHDKYIISCTNKKDHLYYDGIDGEMGWRVDEENALMFNTLASAETTAKNIKSPKGYGKAVAHTYWPEDKEDDLEDDKVDWIVRVSSKQKVYYLTDDGEEEPEEYYWTEDRNEANNYGDQKDALADIKKAPKLDNKIWGKPILEKK
jgi:hypothetical protein